MIFLLVIGGVCAGFSAVAQATPAVPDLSGSWATLQVLAEHWDVPLLGERLRRVVQVARIRIEQEGESLTLRSEEVCTLFFDMGTSLVQIAVTPEFVATVRVGPIPGRIEEESGEFILVAPPYLVVNGVQLLDPEEPLPASAEDPRVLDPDGDGKPGFTVRVRILGLLSGETYVVQRLRQEHRGRILSPDLVRGSVVWQDEQVTLGASSPFFLISGKGRPALDLAFFVLRRLQNEASCAEILALFEEELRR